MEPIKTEQVGPFTVELHYDEDAWHDDPRQWGTAIIVLPERGPSALGPEYLEREGVDVVPGDDDYAEALAHSLGAVHLVPLRFSEHRMGAEVYPVQSWADANAYAYVTSEALSRAGRTPDGNDQWAYGLIESEVATLSAWLSGEVYGYVVTNQEGEHVESCWGFIGEPDYAMSEGRELAEVLAERWEQAPDRRYVDPDELTGGTYTDPNGIVYDIELPGPVVVTKRSPE